MQDPTSKDIDGIPKEHKQQQNKIQNDKHLSLESSLG